MNNESCKSTICHLSKINQEFEDCFVEKQQKYEIKLHKPFEHLINVSEKGIECTFKDIYIDLTSISPIETKPFEIIIPIIGNNPDLSIKLESDYDRLRLVKNTNELRILLDICNIPPHENIFQGTLYINDKSIPVLISVSFRDVKLFVESEGSTFVYENARECFQINKTFIFTDQEIPINVYDEAGKAVDHTLSFIRSSGSAMKDPPILKYDPSTKTSKFSIHQQTDVNMIIDVNVSNINPIKLSFNASVIERKISLQVYNIDAKRFEDNCDLFAGDLECTYFLRFNTYLESVNNELKFSLKSSSSNFVAKFDGFNDEWISQNKFNAVDEYIPFTVKFRKMNNNIEKLSFTVSINSQTIISKSVNVYPCQIEFKSEQKESGKGKNKRKWTETTFKYKIPKPNFRLMVRGMYYRENIRQYADINPQTRLEPSQNTWCVITPFSYQEHTLNDEKAFTRIEYDPNSKEAILPQSTIFEHFVVDQEGKYHKYSQYQYTPSYIKICSRIERSKNDKRVSIWFPSTSNLARIKKVLISNSQLPEIIEEIIYYTELDDYKSLEQINKLKELKKSEQLIDFLIDVFKKRIKEIESQNGYLTFKGNKDEIEYIHKDIQLKVEDVIMPNETLLSADSKVKDTLIDRIQNLDPDKQYDILVRPFKDFVKEPIEEMSSKKKYVEVENNFSIIQKIVDSSPASVITEIIDNFEDKEQYTMISITGVHERSSEHRFINFKNIDIKSTRNETAAMTDDEKPYKLKCSGIVEIDLEGNESITSQNDESLPKDIRIEVNGKEINNTTNPIHQDTTFAFQIEIASMIMQLHAKINALFCQPFYGLFIQSFKQLNTELSLIMNTLNQVNSLIGKPGITQNELMQQNVALHKISMQFFNIILNYNQFIFKINSNLYLQVTSQSQMNLNQNQFLMNPNISNTNFTTPNMNQEIDHDSSKMNQDLEKYN